MATLIPRSDAQCLAWSAKFVWRINANPRKYHVSEDEAYQLSCLQAEFAEKLFMVKSRQTRNPMRIGEKIATRREMVRVLRRTLSKAA